MRMTMTIGRRTLGATLVMVLFAGGGGRMTAAAAPAPPAAAADVWSVYTSPEGRYSVRLPAPPKLSAAPNDNGMGKMTVHMAMAMPKGRWEAYGVTYSDVPGTAPLNPKAALDGAREATARSTGKVLEEKKITLDGYAGREWLVDAPKKGAKMRIRCFLVGRRNYTVMALGRGNVDAVGAEKLFASFKVLAPR